MSVAHPTTVEEWGEYISALSGMELRDQGIGANTLVFVKTLQEEGFTGSQIVQIFTMFAMRFVEVEEIFPIGIPGEYLSYPELLENLAEEEVDVA
jgi:hypothetical protein